MSISTKTYLKIFLLFLTIVYFSACADKYCKDQTSFVTSFDEFSETIKNQNDTFTDEVWITKDKDFQYYANKCYPKYKVQLTIKEKVKVLKNMIAYSYYRSDDNTINLDMKDVDVNFEDELEELTEASKEELEKYLREEFGNSIENAVDEVLKTLNDIGDEIKNWLNKTND